MASGPRTLDYKHHLCTLYWNDGATAAVNQVFTSQTVLIRKDLIHVMWISTALYHSAHSYSCLRVFSEKEFLKPVVTGCAHLSIFKFHTDFSSLDAYGLITAIVWGFCVWVTAAGQWPKDKRLSSQPLLLSIKLKTFMWRAAYMWVGVGGGGEGGGWVWKLIMQALMSVHEVFQWGLKETWLTHAHWAPWRMSHQPRQCAERWVVAAAAHCLWPRHWRHLHTSLEQQQKQQRHQRK